MSTAMSSQPVLTAPASHAAKDAVRRPKTGSRPRQILDIETAINSSAFERLVSYEEALTRSLTEQPNYSASSEFFFEQTSTDVSSSNSSRVPITHSLSNRTASSEDDDNEDDSEWERDDAAGLFRVPRSHTDSEHLFRFGWEAEAVGKDDELEDLYSARQRLAQAMNDVMLASNSTGSSSSEMGSQSRQNSRGHSAKSATGVSFLLPECGDGDNEDPCFPVQKSLTAPVKRQSGQPTANGQMRRAQTDEDSELPRHYSTDGEEEEEPSFNRSKSLKRMIKGLKKMLGANT